MKTISIKQDFNEINISNPLYVERIIKRLKEGMIGDDAEIILDLTGCITDYPDTPLLIDFFLDFLSTKAGSKKLRIIYTGIGTNELHVLYDTVLEGIFFNIKKGNQGNNIIEWIKIINDKLTNLDISLIISCPFDQLEYSYGK